jgi:hypothetical protein
MQIALLKHKRIVVVFSCLLVLSLGACGTSGSPASSPSSKSSPSGPTAAPTHTAVTSPTPTSGPGQAPLAPFKVTAVNMAVTPASIAGMACGTKLTVVYTATFHVVPNSTGGTVQFLYTVNNGRGSPGASLTFAPGETVKTFTFTWSGSLPADHTYPGLGGVRVTSPNSLISQLIAPSGICSSGVALQVTGVDMAVNPTSIAGMACGTSITVTYTATFHVVPNSTGGTVQFLYTVNNGRGSPSASLTFAPGETVKTYSFTWSGNLPADHTYPGLGGVVVTSPNSLKSQMVQPSGMCS